jgi:hypothetical protein
MYFAHVPLVNFCCSFLMEAVILRGNIVTSLNSYAAVQLDSESWGHEVVL